MCHFLHFLRSSLCHFRFLQRVKDDAVWWKDSCEAELVVSATPYICNISDGSGLIGDEGSQLASSQPAREGIGLERNREWYSQCKMGA
jgi:hypothetical protein